MLPGNSTALGGLGNDALVLGELHLQIGFRKLFYRTLLGLHIGERSQRAATGIGDAAGLWQQCAKVWRGNPIASHQHHATLDHITQFSNVAGPVIGGEEAYALFIEMALES